MKQPKYRPTTSQGAGFTGYATYLTPEDSVIDLENWFSSQGQNIRSFVEPEAYVTFLKNKGYFSDNYNTYLNGIKNGAARF